MMRCGDKVVLLTIGAASLFFDSLFRRIFAGASFVWTDSHSPGMAWRRQ